MAAITYVPLETIVVDLFKDLEGSDATQREVKEFVDIMVSRDALEKAKVRVGNVDHYSRECIRFLFNCFIAYRFGATPDLIATMVNDPMSVVAMVADVDRSYQDFAGKEDAVEEGKNGVQERPV